MSPQQAEHSLELYAQVAAEEAEEALVTCAKWVKRQRGTSVDLLELVEILGLQEALDTHRAIT